MKNALIVIIITTFLFSNSYGMEPVQQYNWDILPTELKVKILSYAHSASTLHQALKMFKELRLVNKEFKQIINDPNTLKAFIKEYIKAHPEEIMRAVLVGDINQVKLLLKEGANSNYQSQYGETPLLSAVMLRNEEMVKLLLEHGADVNAQTLIGDTVLHQAAYLGFVPFLELLLKAGADVHIVDEEGKTALDKAQERFLAQQNFAAHEIYLLNQAYNEIIELLRAATESEKNKRKREDQE